MQPNSSIYVQASSISVHATAEALEMVAADSEKLLKLTNIAYYNLPPELQQVAQLTIGAAMSATDFLELADADQNELVADYFGIMQHESMTLIDQIAPESRCTQINDTSAAPKKSSTTRLR